MPIFFGPWVGYFRFWLCSTYVIHFSALTSKRITVCSEPSWVSWRLLVLGMRMDLCRRKW